MNMKRLFCTLFISLNVCAIGSKAQSVDSLGLPGDNLDLSGVLELFKQTENPEEFEKKLNSSETKLNNLDLNGDGETDYIRVIDRTENNLHALVLQIPVNEDESQDVAVIEIEKKDDGSAHLQIVGDEELYGKNYIIEPKDEASKAATSATNPATQNQQPSTTTSTTTERATTNPPPPVIVNVWGWPSVRYIYGPAYNPWVSPWRWRYYPPYWRPWRPVFWSAYHPHWHSHWAHYHRVHAHRIAPAHDMYYSHRKVSRTVYQKRSAAPGAAPAVQPRTRRAPEQRAPHRQRVEQRQPRNSAPRSNQPRQQNKPRGGARSSGSGPRK
jgi:hypothetical protein